MGNGGTDKERIAKLETEMITVMEVISRLKDVPADVKSLKTMVKWMLAVPGIVILVAIGKVSGGEILAFIGKLVAP